MNGSVLFEGNPILSGSLNVNTDGNIEPLEVEITENGTREITPPSGVDGYAPITIKTNVPQIEPVLETLNVTQNGRYEPPSGVAGFDEVNVEVLHPLDTLSVTENGSYEPPTGVYGFSNVNVNVPIPTPTLETLNITQNGTYTTPSGVDGYDKVNVNVPLPENAYLLEEYEDVPTDIASFTASDAPLKSLTASIVPVQSGSGEPSPTNIRPISGHTEANVSVSDINVWDEETRGGYYDVLTGSYVSYADQLCCKDYISVRPNMTLYEYKGSYTSYGELLFYDCNHDYIGYLRPTQWINKEFTIPSNCYYITFNLGSAYGAIYNNDISINYPSTDTEYHAYSGTTTTIPFTDGQGQSVKVFGGEIDVINGVVTPCPYYASYNGEQLTGEWISDRDVYSPNTTPTTGAQVVNIGATGTPLSVQPTSIKSLDGVNNVFASTGDVKELKFYNR